MNDTLLGTPIRSAGTEMVRVTDLALGDVIVDDGVVGPITMLDTYDLTRGGILVLHEGTPQQVTGMDKVVDVPGGPQWPVVRIFISAGDATHGIARFPHEWVQRLRDQA